VAKAIAKRPQSAAGGTVGRRGGPGMAAILGPGGPIIRPWTVRGEHFRGGTVHGVTVLLSNSRANAIMNSNPFEHPITFGYGLELPREYLLVKPLVAGIKK